MARLLQRKKTMKDSISALSTIQNSNNLTPNLKFDFTYCNISENVTTNHKNVSHNWNSKMGWNVVKEGKD